MNEHAMICIVLHIGMEYGFELIQNWGGLFFILFKHFNVYYIMIRYNFCICMAWQEICMGCLESLSRGYRSTDQPLRSPLADIRCHNVCHRASGPQQLARIPPTLAALIQHVRRSTFQGGYIWGQCLIPSPWFPEPKQWGWIWQNVTKSLRHIESSPSIARIVRKEATSVAS